MESKIKQLRFDTKELREIFEQITVRYISEFDLETASMDEKGNDVKNRMIKNNFDVMPVTSNSKISMYVSWNIPDFL